MLTRQAKVLTKAQQLAVLSHISRTRAPERNRVILLLSFKAGLRAKEIASLKWSMVTDSEGNLADAINLTNDAAKGQTGGSIPIAKDLRDALLAWREQPTRSAARTYVISTERSDSTTAQVIVNLFSAWYRQLGFEGCSSHSGRRTFITNAARNIGRFGGSLRDVQALARHSSLAMTQRYIDQNTEAMRRVVDAQ